MLVTAGLSDPRITYWEPAKWVAKLRSTKTGNNLLLLKTNMGAGHGGKSGRYVSLEDAAKEFTWRTTRTALGIEYLLADLVCNFAREPPYGAVGPEETVMDRETKVTLRRARNGTESDRMIDEGTAVNMIAHIMDQPRVKRSEYSIIDGETVYESSAIDELARRFGFLEEAPAVDKDAALFS